MSNRHFSVKSQKLCSPLSFSTQAAASWDTGMLSLVSGHESRPSEMHLRREEDFAPQSVSACMAVLRTDPIPIRNMAGWPAAEVGVSCMDSPEPAAPRRALERARLPERADEAARENPHSPFANTELLGRAG